MAGYRLPRGGTRDRPHAAASLLASTARAVVRLCRRHRRLGAARLRAHARRALLQVSSPARHLFGRRRRSRTRWLRSAAARPPSRTPRRRSSRRATGCGAQPERLAFARQRFRRGQRPVRAVLRRGLLLQDLHGPVPRRAGCSTSRSSAAPRGSARRASSPTPTATRRRTPSATCWSWAAARPGSPRRSPRAVPAPASSSATTQPVLGGALDLEDALGRRRCRPTGCSRRSPRSNGLAECARCMKRTSVYGYYDDNVLGAVRDPFAPGSRHAARAAPLAHPGAARRARHRRDRAALRVPRQRHAGRHARERGARLRAPLRRCGRARGRRLHQQRCRLAARRRAVARRACRCARSSTRARGAGRRLLTSSPRPGRSA